MIPAIRIARELPQSDAIIVNLSGRGDKDMPTLQSTLLAGAQ